jgi:hypothetical protein
LVEVLDIVLDVGDGERHDVWSRRVVVVRSRAGAGAGDPLGDAWRYIYLGAPRLGETIASHTFLNIPLSPSRATGTRRGGGLRRNRRPDWDTGKCSQSHRDNKRLDTPFPSLAPPPPPATSPPLSVLTPSGNSWAPLFAPSIPCVNRGMPGDWDGME